jgi:hypothetical protein
MACPGEKLADRANKTSSIFIRSLIGIKASRRHARRGARDRTWKCPRRASAVRCVDANRESGGLAREEG